MSRDRHHMSSALRQGGAAKVDNNPVAHAAKVELRRSVLEAVGRDAWVFDAFAGKGAMHGEVWCDAAHYVGCDMIWYRDGRSAYVCDNRRVMRAIDLAPFRVFDFDAYGSPWDQLTIFAARRRVQPGETIGLCITEGSALKMKMGGFPASLLAMARLTGTAGGARRNVAGQVIERALRELVRRLGCTVTKRWQAEGKTGAQMRYFGLVLTGNPES